MVLIFSSNFVPRWSVNTLEMFPVAWFSGLPVIFEVFRTGWRTFVPRPVKGTPTATIQGAVLKPKTMDLTLWSGLRSLMPETVS